MVGKMKVFKFLLRIVYCVIFLVLLNEIADNLLLSRWLATPNLTLQSSERTVNWPMRRDPVLGWTLAPPPEAAVNMDREFGMVGSGIGARWLPAALDMGPPLKLLLIGDETSFGVDMPLEDTMGGWIKKDTEKRLPDRTVAVCNASVPGYDSMQMYLLFKKLTLLEPHLAVICFSSGEILSPTVDESARRPIDPKGALNKDLFYRPALTQAAYLLLGRLTGSEEVAGIEWKVDRSRLLDTKIVMDRDRFEDILMRIIDVGEAARTTLVFANIGLPERLRSRLEHVCNREDIAYFDGDLALKSHLESGMSDSRKKIKDTDGKRDERALAKAKEEAESNISTESKWWTERYIRDEMAPVFLLGYYFDERFLPTRNTHRIVGRRLSELIEERDLFSWRHRVLK
jgi:hypothetical protein